ncbi:hypothetical protein ID866_3915 [Astraeus odoratus]|nr:hypothetical protein ID866_3915 [Astraeus odoratus]
MPDIPVGSQIFDLVFHPTSATVYTGLLDGHIKALRYDEQGQYEQTISLRPSKRSCRALLTNEDGSRLYAGGKAKSIFGIDTATGSVLDTVKDAHESPINRMKRLLPNMFCTGDDDGVIKLWDTRELREIRRYTHHFDFVSDFLWLEAKRQLISTSGDGTLSVIDVRGKKAEPLAQSEDQEDELLSIVPSGLTSSGSKAVVGTQLGILTIFNASHGWGDCVDRVPGHPQSIDALCGLPSSYPSSHSTILTGSSDGLLRVVQLFPTKLLGVVADHGSFPIERIAIDQNGEGRWVGSAGHEDTLKMTDLKEVLEDEGSDAGISSDERESDGEKGGPAEQSDTPDTREDDVLSETEHTGVVSGDSEKHKEKKRKRKGQKDALAGRKKGRNEIDADPSFFAGL